MSDWSDTPAFKLVHTDIPIMSNALVLAHRCCIWREIEHWLALGVVFGDKRRVVGPVTSRGVHPSNSRGDGNTEHRSRTRRDVGRDKRR